MHEAGAVAGGDAFYDLQHPSLELASREAARAPPFAHDGSEVEWEPLEDEDVVVVVAAGEVVEERDDMRGGLRGDGEEGVGLALCADSIVDLLEGNRCAVGAATAAVDVGVGAGASASEDIVEGGDVRAAVDAPAPASAAAADRHRDRGTAWGGVFLFLTFDRKTGRGACRPTGLPQGEMRKIHLRSPNSLWSSKIP